MSKDETIKTETALARAFRDFKWADELLRLAADRVKCQPSEVTVRGFEWTLEIMGSGRLVVEMKLTMPHDADPSDEQYWQFQLAAAHAVLDASAPDPRAD